MARLPLACTEKNWLHIINLFEYLLLFTSRQLFFHISMLTSVYKGQYALGTPTPAKNSRLISLDDTSPLFPV